MKTTKQKQNEVFAVLKEKMGWTNLMQAPRLSKVVISVGTGSFKDKKKNELVAARLMKITGQKPAPRGAKKTIASFKIPLGDLIGYQINLRGQRPFGFLDKMCNITIGIKEHTIFPETADEDLRDVFGLAITIVTTAQNRAEALAFFEHIGIPFRKK